MGSTVNRASASFFWRGGGGGGGGERFDELLPCFLGLMSGLGPGSGSRGLLGMFQNWRGGGGGHSLGPFLFPPKNAGIAPLSWSEKPKPGTVATQLNVSGGFMGAPSPGLGFSIYP